MMGYWPALRGTLADAAASVSKTADRIFRGDVRSANWDGGGDLSGGRDTTATQGYLIDYSSGSAQFVNIYADGGELRTLTITDVLTVDGGAIRSAASGMRYEFIETGATAALLFYSGHVSEQAPGFLSVSSDLSMALRGTATSGSYNSLTVEGVPLLLLGGTGSKLQGTAELLVEAANGDLTLQTSDDLLITSDNVTLDATTLTLFGDLVGMAAWSPSYANLTVGNGTVVARYQRFGDVVICWFDFILGTTSSVGSAATISAPVTASSSYTASHNTIGPSRFFESGAAAYLGNVRLESTTTLRPVIPDITGTYPLEAGITASVPFTWGTGDRLMFTATYEAA